jgi:phosphoribosylformylglycinamidine (FGAM) synthase-like enzyme
LVISLKAETHNFPTTVEPFNGAATGSGGEIRDRLAGGQGSFHGRNGSLHDFVFSIRRK